MAKIYYNNFYDRAIIVNERDKTFKLAKATRTRKQVAFCYHVKIERLIELKTLLLNRGFLRA